MVRVEISKNKFSLPPPPPTPIPMDIKKLMVSCLILLSDPPSANPRISFTAALKILNKLKTILLSVCLYPKVKTAEPIGPKFCVVPHMTHRKGLNLIKISKSSPQ